MNEIEEKLAIAQAEIRELKAQLTIDAAVADGDTLKATRWLQDKCRRQAAALEVLNRRVVNQRFQLRTLNELGRGLTREEFLAAKAEVSNEQVAGKLEFASA